MEAYGTVYIATYRFDLYYNIYSTLAMDTI